MRLLVAQIGGHGPAVAGRVPAARRRAAWLGAWAAATLVSSLAACAIAAPLAAAEAPAGFYPAVVRFNPVLAPEQVEGGNCGKGHSNQTCGGSQLWTVPAGVNALTLYVDGGAGGAGGLSGGAGGLGGGVRATFAVNPGDTLVIAVGHNGQPSYAQALEPGGTLWLAGVGGWPSGGPGGDGACEEAFCRTAGALGGGGGGGGYSEVSLLAYGEPQTALVVAPGGGGGGGATTTGRAGGKGGEAEASGAAGNGGGGAGAIGEEPGSGGSGSSGSFNGDAGTGHNGVQGGVGGDGGNVGGGGGGAGWSGGGGGGAGFPPSGGSPGSAGGAGGGGGGGGYYVDPTASSVIRAGGASVGEVSIGYGTFVEEPAKKEEQPSPPKIETPNPNPVIVGEPVVRKTLKCEPGPSNGAQYTVTFLWLREGAPIAGATAQTYVVGSADAGHKLQCRVVETDAAGSANATSGFVSVGAAASAGAIGVHQGAALVPVTCAGALGSCTVTATLSVVERLAGKRLVALSASRHRSTTVTRVVTIGARTITLAHGQHATLTVKLNSAGMRLLAARLRVPARVQVRQSTSAGAGRTIATRTVFFTR